MPCSLHVQPLSNIKSKKMIAKKLREAFKEFVGKEKYILFILTLYEAFPLRNKLFFWQEQLLKDFSNKFDIKLITIENIYQIFNYCPIHNYELKNDNVPIVDGNEFEPKISHQKAKELFPMANLYAPRDLTRFIYPKNIEVVYCEKCRDISKGI